MPDKLSLNLNDCGESNTLKAAVNPVGYIGMKI